MEMGTIFFFFFYLSHLSQFHGEIAETKKVSYFTSSQCSIEVLTITCVFDPVDITDFQEV